MTRTSDPAVGRTRSIPYPSDLFNFLVAFAATMTAVWIPRLTTGLLSRLGDAEVSILSDEYLNLSLAVAALIGLVVAFQQWEKRPHPWRIFVGALAVPSILSGMYNTTDATLAASDLSRQLGVAVAGYQKAGQVAISPGEDIPVLRWQGLELIAPDAGGVGDQSFRLPDLLIAPALAAEQKIQGAPAPTYGGIKVDQPQALIVLGNCGTIEAARATLEGLREKLPGAQIARMGERYCLLQSPVARPFGDVVEEAARLKRDYGYELSILPVPENMLE